MKLQMHGNWCLFVNDNNTPIVNKTWWETYALAKEWSVRSGKNLVLIPIKTAEQLCEKDKAFKDIMEKYWIWNAEIMKACKNNVELAKRLKLKTKYVYQWSGDNDLSSVRSTWDSDEGCFHALAHWPSDGDDCGVIAFLVRERAVK